MPVSFFDGGFLDKHDRYLIADRVDQAAIGVNTFEPCFGVIDLYPRPALWASEYLEQFRADGHIFFSKVDNYFSLYFRRAEMARWGARCSRLEISYHHRL